MRNYWFNFNKKKFSFKNLCDLGVLCGELNCYKMEVLYDKETVHHTNRLPAMWMQRGSGPFGRGNARAVRGRP
jgi:hypothetical protein